ncbi:MAG: NAD(P)H-dependent oxidoreductase [Eubacteriales bacterium]|nr:NAD(P)H-dependent oxidoreductase [Eubacteriales bacterium]
MILFINACVRGDSRTRRLADRLLEKLNEPFEEIRPAEFAFPVADEAFLTKRDRLIRERAFDDPLFAPARQFAAAERIVVAAPFWDLSFPACLKQYFEQINVLGLTFRYAPDGVPEGLCRADALYYVTTAGGEFFPTEYGFGYVEALSRNFYGVRNVKLIAATGLDIVGADVEAILRSAENAIETLTQAGQMEK